MRLYKDEYQDYLIVDKNIITNLLTNGGINYDNSKSK